MVNNKHSIDHLLEFRLVCNWKYLVNHFEVKFKNFNVNIRIWYFAIHYVSLSFTINIDSKHVFIFSKLVPLKIDRLKRNYLTKPLHSRNLHEQYCSSFNAHEFWWSTLSMSIRSLAAQKLMCLCIMCLSMFIHSYLKYINTNPSLPCIYAFNWSMFTLKNKYISFWSVVDFDVTMCHGILIKEIYI